jgi:hypothetical protein
VGDYATKPGLNSLNLEIGANLPLVIGPMVAVRQGLGGLLLDEIRRRCNFIALSRATTSLLFVMPQLDLIRRGSP